VSESGTFPRNISTRCRNVLSLVDLNIHYLEASESTHP
jgi:hypothetical protein